MTWLFTKHSSLTPGLLLCLIWALPVQAATASQARATELSPQSKLVRLNEAIAAQDEKVKQKAAQEFNLVQKLKRLDSQLAQEQEKLQAIQQQLMRQESYLQVKTQEMSLIKKEKGKLETHIKKRLSAFYKMGGVTVLNTLFAAESLPEFLNLKEYFQAMLHYDQQIIQNYRTQLSLLAQAQNSIEQNKNKLLGIISEEKKQEQQLINSRQERNELLARIKTQKNLYLQAMEEMKKAADRLAATINKLKVPVISGKPKKIYRSRAGRKHPAVPISGFAAQMGKLAPPVHGEISRYFGVQAGSFGIKVKSSGLDFKTESGMKVHAIWGGKIIFSDIIDGYGKMIIIDHGQQYYSLVSGLATITKFKGDEVKKGDIIGLTGDSGGLLNNGMHFEIRHGAQPIDPLPWLNKKQNLAY